MSTGQCKQLIDEIIDLRTDGQPQLAGFVRATLIVKGILPDKYSDTTPDDPEMVAKLKAMASRLQN